MSDNKPFMGPQYDKIIDEDPQFIRVPLENMHWASRKSITNSIGKLDDAANLVHVKD